MTQSRSRARGARWLKPARDGLIWTVVLVLVVTLPLLPARTMLPDAVVALAYLLVVLFAGARSGRAVALAVAGIAFLSYNWFFLLGQSLMPALNALLLGSLLYRSRLVPRILPLVGLIGAPLLLASDVAVLFGLWDRISAPSGILALPIAAWEFSLGVYLVVRGFKPSPITAGMVAAGTTPEAQN